MAQPRQELPIVHKVEALAYARKRLREDFGLKPISSEGASGDEADEDFGGWDELLRLVYTDRRPLHIWGPDPVGMHPANRADRGQANKADYIRQLSWSVPGPASAADSGGSVDTGYGSTNDQLDAIIRLLLKMEHTFTNPEGEGSAGKPLYDSDAKSIEVTLKVDGHPRALICLGPGLSVVVNHSGTAMYLVCEKALFLRALEHSSAVPEEPLPLDSGEIVGEKFQRYEQCDDDDTEGDGEEDHANPFARKLNSFHLTVPIKIQERKYNKKKLSELRDGVIPVVWKGEMLEVRRQEGRQELSIVKFCQRLRSVADFFEQPSRQLPRSDVDGSLILLRTGLHTAVEEYLPFAQLHWRLQDLALTDPGTTVSIESTIEQSVFAQFRDTRERMSKLGFCPRTSPDCFRDPELASEESSSAEAPFTLDEATAKAVAGLGPVFHSKVRLFGEADRCDKIFDKLVVFDVRRADGTRLPREFVERQLLGDPIFERGRWVEPPAPGGCESPPSFLSAYGNHGCGRLVVPAPLIMLLSLKDLVRSTPVSGLISIKLPKKEMKAAKEKGDLSKFKRQRAGVVERRLFEPKRSFVPSFYATLEEELGRLLFEATDHGVVRDTFLAEGFIFRFCGVDVRGLGKELDERALRFGELLYKFKNSKYDVIA